ncbi:MAG: hypothetical protein KAG61_11250 [Bacteriovoracaceae bacterium]|nr:hypothetical protein [Bacteriovoracaceae bacterium]
MNLSKRRIESLVFIVIFFGIFGYIGHAMGVKNMLSTIMATAHDLLLNTVFYIMSITVLAGAFGNLMMEFGVIRIFEKILNPLMKPVFNLPGVASLGAVMTFFSDNPAIISLASSHHFRKYFRPTQFVSLTNFGTAFGMGLVVMTFMMGQGHFKPAVIGFCGAIMGAMVSTRIMQKLIRTHVRENWDEDEIDMPDVEDQFIAGEEPGVFMRFLNAILDGGKKGVETGLSIIPGVLIICTVVLLFTFGPKNVSIGYQGLAYEGVPLLPLIGELFAVPFHFLFGFTTPEAIAFPITALGAVGASLSLVPAFLEKGIIGANEIAVFTAMGMCWSGYLSTHTAMLDAMGFRELTSKALISHTIGGIVAGVVAHHLYWLSTLI